MADKDPLDPKGVIAESYRIHGITKPECRSIFLDWALGAPEGDAATEAIRALIARHETDAPDHPMTHVLREGLEAPRRTGRRGGRAARIG
ncbi:MAG: hypothetical protein AAFR35_16165 [Pseudomonadota bacterium]